MTSDSSGGGGGGGGGSSRAGEAWEQRAASVIGEVQRWLIRSSARSLRDEVNDQVRRVFRSAEPDPRDVWDQATTEPPPSGAEPPECAWCPICRAARMVAESRRPGSRTPPSAASAVADAADAMIGAVREALSGLDSLLSYRPASAGGTGGASQPEPEGAGEAGPAGGDDTASDSEPGGRLEDHEREPDDRG